MNTRSLHEKDSMAVLCGKNYDYSDEEGWIIYGFSQTRR
jgi:hypothetical protein